MASLKNAKLQSAMEYLMTYGWAILAIAIVMVSLYSLGIFNLGNLSPTATPGSCQVIRTAAQTSLAGQCNNIIPKYVGQFNGATGYIDSGSSPFLRPSQVTVSAWIWTNTPVTWGLIAGYQFTSAWDSYFLSLGGSTSPTNITFGTSTAGGGADASRANGPSVTDGKWHFVVGEYDSTSNMEILYVDGSLYTSSAGRVIGYNVSKTLRIGKSSAFGQFQGSISNVQIYNASLDSATIKSLYQEGIGGAPIDLTHIVGWWPLNGNSNDYSGNNNQGTSTKVIWNANWQSGYTAPAS